jgi:ABC-type transport system involved in cytochrome c biogenesis permease subunit
MPVDRLLAAGLGGVALVGAALARRRPAFARGGAWTTALALGAWLAARWVAAGHPPVFGTFETDLAETLLLLVSGLWIARREGPAYLRGPLVVAALTFAHTFALRPEITPVTISEQSLWIDLHAVLAWAAWAAYFHALFLALGGRPAETGLPRESRALRVLGVAFVAQSAMGFVGVYYATLLFARPWEWDPVQTLGLLSWLLCALCLHLRLFFGASLQRQRVFLGVVVVVFVVSAKLVMLLGSGQSFHVFELGSMAGPGVK